MDSISSLRSTLISSLDSTEALGAEQDLFDELTVNRPRLLKVLDFGPRNPQEQRDVDSGRIEIDGHPLTVNANFASQVKFIAQLLDCSERHCATLLHSVLSENPTINQVEAVEQSVLAYHRVRRELTDCLQFIFQAVEVAQNGSSLPTYIRINEYAQKQLIGGDKKENLAYKIFAEMDKLGSAIVNAKVAVTNAITNTNLPSPHNANGNLGHAVLSARLESFLYERRTLAFTLYFIGRAGYLTSSEMHQIVDWLIKNPKHDMMPYVLATVLAAFDLSLSPPESSGSNLRIALVKSPNTTATVKSKLSAPMEWKDSSLKAAIQLKWTLFLTEARLRDVSLENRDDFKNEDLEGQIFSAVQGNSFAFLLGLVSHLSVPYAAGAASINRSSPESSDPKIVVAGDFKPRLLHEIELLLRSLLTHAPAELRKIKHKQEDQFRPRADRLMRSSHGFVESITDKPNVAPRNDIITLFQLLGQLYTFLPEDSAIQFWGGVPNTETPAYYEIAEAERGKLPSFLRWAVEVRDPDLIISVFDMLAGLATGIACSEFAYNFMATGTLDVVHGGSVSLSSRYETSAAFTWGSIFGELESWAALGMGQRGPHNALPAQLPIAASDVLLGLSFLKLLSTVAKHSIQARLAIFSHPQYRAISCLVSLIPLGVPLELKGALFDALSSFCEPGAGVQGVEVCRNVWAQMERLEVINVRGGNFASKGIEVELEEVESLHRVYPATIPFLELLSTLIHTPKRVPLKNRVTEPEPINTIPENLGQPYRIPGISPFVTFVVDNVLAKLPKREFSDISDQWKMADLSLCFLERCLASYDLEALPNLAEEFNTKGPEVLVPVVHHPGFDVLVRILSDTPLRATIISYTVEGSDELYRQQGNPQFASVLLRTLRIVERVLAIQDIFLEQLLPVVSEYENIMLPGSRISQSFLSRIDQGLSLDRRSIPSIGTYVNHPAQPEITFLSVKILAALAQSPSFHDITVLIERSPESTVILDGFVRLLAVDSADDIGAAEEWTYNWTGAGAPNLEGDQHLFDQAIRLAILDLLLHGTKHRKSSALSFLFLFGKSTLDAQIQDPHALGSRQNCLHVILELLNAGIPRINAKGKEREHRRTKCAPLFETQPVLAERLYKLIYQLCEHPRTSSAMMLYLRTREDFFARHLAVMTVRVPVDTRRPFIEVLYSDGSRTVTTCTTLRAFLQLRSWLLDLVSLELHILTSRAQHQRVKDLLDLLFGTTDPFLAAEADWEHDMFQPFNDVGQSRIRVIELFQSLEFEWYDSVTINPVDLQYLKTLNLQSCLRTNDNGCEVVDRTTLFEMLSQARRTLLRQSRVSTVSQNAQLNEETKYILESCVVENNRREVQFALNIGYESWKRLAEVVLTKCFNRIARDQRESILFDLLHVLPPAVHAAALPETSAVLLSELLVLLITKLREERHQALLLSSAASLETAALPSERMTALLRHILECILDKRRRELVRGNLYAALSGYLHLILQPRESSSLSLPLGVSHSNYTSSLSLSINGNKTVHGQLTALETVSFATIKPVIDRLVTTVARDAIDGAEVWRTVAFSLFETLSRLSRLDTRNIILTSLDRQGLLANFVHGIKDTDFSLQNVLLPDPDDLNPLYVYEARVSFLSRLAQSYEGSERLLDARALSLLAQVDYLDARPEADDNSGQNNFMPSAISRYHQLLVPALQLVGAILASAGPKHANAQKQALDFINNHRDTFVIMLKEDILSLSSMEELDLIISISSFILPSISKVELFSLNSGFGGLHNAILALASRCINSSKWWTTVQPTDETESMEAKVQASNHDLTESKFDFKVRRMVQRLRRSLINYLSAASNMDESEITVVVSPIITSRKDERPSGISVPLPSLKDILGALYTLCDDLTGVTRSITDIDTELEHRDHVRIDNAEELLDGVEVDVLRRLDITQRRALVCRVLENTSSDRKLQAGDLLASIEKLLHLLWTHVLYYSTEQLSSSGTSDRQRPFSQPRAPQQSLKQSTLRFLSVPDADSFRAEAVTPLAKIVEKIEAIDLGNEYLNKSWQGNKSYLNTLCRCLKDVVASDSTAMDRSSLDRD